MDSKNSSFVKPKSNSSMPPQSSSSMPPQSSADVNPKSVCPRLEGIPPERYGDWTFHPMGSGIHGTFQRLKYKTQLTYLLKARTCSISFLFLVFIATIIIVLLHFTTDLVVRTFPKTNTT